MLMSMQARKPRAATSPPPVQKAPAGSVQPKLSVSSPGDRCEREADEVARAVVGSGDQPGSAPCCASCAQGVQRQADDEQEEDTNAALQGKESTPAGLAQSAANTALPVLRGAGSPLSPAVRAYFEPRMHHDFADVRVHIGDEAAHSARALRAHAYTVDRDVVFGAGRFQPDTADGKRLLAHELTHVMQQRAGRSAIMRQDDGSGDQSQQAPKRSVVFPDWMTADQPATTDQQPAATDQPATTDQQDTVSRAVDGAAASAPGTSPEQAAAAERPFHTGLSSGALAAALGAGRPLDGRSRAQLESRHGVSLAHVRTYTDEQAGRLCDRFGARAFTRGTDIAFARGEYSPGTVSGDELLRHEVAHVLSPPGPSGAIFRAAAACTQNCPAAGATAYAATSDATFNCYSYALGTPAMLFRQPGESSSSADWTDLHGTDPARRRAAAARYFTPAGMLRNISSDLGSPIATDCTNCCVAPKRKVIAVTSNALSSVGIDHWDFHWYRKDADRSWSHKVGPDPSRQTDASGVSPICNPCTSDRDFSAENDVNYNNVVGSWCV